jgi:hypothetical protein
MMVSAESIDGRSSFTTARAACTIPGGTHHTSSSKTTARGGQEEGPNGHTSWIASGGRLMSRAGSARSSSLPRRATVVSGIWADLCQVPYACNPPDDLLHQVLDEGALGAGVVDHIEEELLPRTQPAMSHHEYDMT